MDMLCSRPCSSPKKVTSTWLFPTWSLSLNDIYLIKFSSFQLYRNKMVSHCHILATCLSHLAQFVRFIHLDMFDCYLYTFTDELIRNILLIHFPGDEHWRFFSFYSTVTNHAAIWTLCMSTGAHQASLGHESTSRVTSFWAVNTSSPIRSGQLFF